MRLYFILLLSVAFFNSQAQSKSLRVDSKLNKIRMEVRKLGDNLSKFDTLNFDWDTISVQVFYNKELQVLNCSQIILDTSYHFQIKIYRISESTRYYCVNYPNRKYTDLFMMHETFVEDGKVLFEWWPSAVRICTLNPDNLETSFFYEYPLIWNYEQLREFESSIDNFIKS